MVLSKTLFVAGLYLFGTALTSNVALAKGESKSLEISAPSSEQPAGDASKKPHFYNWSNGMMHCDSGGTAGGTTYTKSNTYRTSSQTSEYTSEKEK